MIKLFIGVEFDLFLWFKVLVNIFFGMVNFFINVCKIIWGLVFLMFKKLVKWVVKVVFWGNCCINLLKVKVFICFWVWFMEIRLGLLYFYIVFIWGGDCWVYSFLLMCWDLLLMGVIWGKDWVNFFKCIIWVVRIKLGEGEVSIVV